MQRRILRLSGFLPSCNIKLYCILDLAFYSHLSWSLLRTCRNRSFKFFFNTIAHSEFLDLKKYIFFYFNLICLCTFFCAISMIWTIYFIMQWRLWYFLNGGLDNLFYYISYLSLQDTNIILSLANLERPKILKHKIFYWDGVFWQIIVE